ncbi:MAG: ferrous iron transport protein A [Phycisphaerales bacterium]|nr:MAG: ferrous iron transport protein A [Phycisphaerales bacterium]
MYSEPNSSPQRHDDAPVPLSKLGIGDRGIVCETRLGGDDCELLQAMGLTNQSRVRVCQPGQPCIVQVNSTRLGLSAAVADKIFVQPDRMA